MSKSPRTYASPSAISLIGPSSGLSFLNVTVNCGAFGPNRSTSPEARRSSHEIPLLATACSTSSLIFRAASDRAPPCGAAGAGAGAAGVAGWELSSRSSVVCTVVRSYASKGSDRWLRDGAAACLPSALRVAIRAGRGTNERMRTFKVLTAAAALAALAGGTAVAQQPRSDTGTDANGPITILKNMQSEPDGVEVDVDGAQVDDLKMADYADITGVVHRGQNTLTVRW